MRKIDTIYFDAIASANSGHVDRSGLIAIHNAARDRLALDDLEESCRQYERILQIFSVCSDNAETQDLNLFGKFFCIALEEYAELLRSLNRTERQQQVAELAVGLRLRHFSASVE